MYDMSIITDRRVRHSKPDLNIQNRGEHTDSIVDVAVPMDRNCVKKYSKKLKIYRDLYINIQ